MNPASIGGGSATLDSVLPLTTTSTPPPPPVTTPWVTYPDLYSGSCEQGGGTTWLASHAPRPSEGRPVVTQSLGPTWGYHADDINLTLGNLINDVRTEEAAYTARH